MLDRAGHNLDGICDELWSIRSDAIRYAAETRWESDAARAFHTDADALAADIAALRATVSQLHDDLQTTRTRLAQRMAGCG